MSAEVDSDARATAEQVRSARRRLHDLATMEGLSDLRLAPDGTLVVHVDDDPGYRAVLRFVEAATKALGAEPNVVTDAAPAAQAKLTTAVAL